MSYYANSEERAELIAGLRELAEFLDQNPQVPAPRSTDLLVFPPDGSDAEMFAEIDVIAGQIGAHGQRRRQPGRPLQRGRATSARCSTAPSPSRNSARHRERRDRIAMLHLILCSVVLVAAPAHRRPGPGHHRHPPQRARQAADRPARRPQRSARPPAAGRLARLRRPRRHRGRRR